MKTGLRYKGQLFKAVSAAVNLVSLLANTFEPTIVIELHQLM